MTLAYHPCRDDHDFSIRRVNDFHKAIMQAVPQAFNVLDIGMGYGYLVRKLLLDGKNAVGIDLRNLGQTNLVIADARILPFKDSSFDLVTECRTFDDMYGLQHLFVSELNKTVSEIHRVLRSDGTVITWGVMTDLYRESFHTIKDEETGFGIFRK